MEFNKLLFAGLSVGCLTAAAAGSYLAVRQNQSASALEQPSELRRDSGAVNPATPPAVTESEGVIAPAPTQPEAAPLPPSAPARRAPAVDTSRPTSSRAARVVERPSTPDSQPSGQAAGRSGQERTSETVSAPANSGSMWETRPSVQPSAPEYREPEPPAPPPPPAPEFVDLTVPADAVLGLQIERTVSSELARVEDRVDARVTRDVRVADRVAIPAGSTVRGSVSEVDRGGRMKGKARLAIKFHTIVLADGTQVPLKTDAVVREGQSPGGESAAKVGGAAIGGAILGAILGGGKGAAIGGAVGAGAGTAAAMTNDRNPATLAAGTTVTVRMQAPVTVTVQKE
jgi:type IV secretory pathway VirB10-like protein